jgi:hypothetical protein
MKTELAGGKYTSEPVVLDRKRLFGGKLTPASASRNYSIWLAFLGLVILNWSPFWLFAHFPSQDGPSHLYNTVVLSSYNTTQLYQHFYNVVPNAAGNVFTEILLVGALKFLSPILAERLLLSAYVVLLPLSVMYLLRSMGKRRILWTLAAFLFVPNWFLHSGFWNFCFGAPLALFALGFYIRHRHHWTWSAYLSFGLLGLAVYSAHIVSWGVVVGSVIAAIVFERLASRTETDWRRLWSDDVGPASKPLLCLLPGLALAIIHGWNDHTPAVFDKIPLTRRLHALFSCFALNAGTDDYFIAACVALLGAAFVVAVRHRFQNGRRLAYTDFLLAFSFLFVVLALVAPDSIGNGAYVRDRLGFFGWLFLFLWIAVQEGPAVWSRWCAALLCLLSVAWCLYRMPMYSKWSGAVSELADTTSWIQPNSTVLAVNLNSVRSIRFQPLLHAIDLLTPKPFIDLRNYEASLNYFLVNFRPEMSPATSLGGRDELEADLPTFDIERYENHTHSRVDYLIFYSSYDLAPYLDKGGPYRNQLRKYRLIHITQPRRIARIYQRIP